MNTQQTAVGWLKTTLKNMVDMGADFWEDYPALEVHIEQALAMEKVQMELCAVHMAEKVISVIDEGSEWKEGGKEFEDYYNQTYNHEK